MYLQNPEDMSLESPELTNSGLTKQLRLELLVVGGTDQLQFRKLPLRTEEFREEKHVNDVLPTAYREQQECWPDGGFDTGYFVGNLLRIINDVNRTILNGWLVYRGEECVAFAYGIMQPLLHVRKMVAVLQMVYVIPEERGSYAYIKLVKRFEEWARDNNAVKMTLGVERIDSKQDAIKIKKLFPRLGYKWAGSFYTKEVV